MRTFDNSEFKKHQTEVTERWGSTDAYKKYEEKTKDYSKEQLDTLAQRMDRLMAEFSICMKKGAAPGGAQVQSLVALLQDHITENYYPCTKAILAGLGHMYVADERFRNNIDRHAEGTAKFISEAIAVYCSK